MESTTRSKDQQTSSTDESRFDPSAGCTNVLNTCFDEIGPGAISDEFRFATDEVLQQAIESMKSAFNELPIDERNELREAFRQASESFEDSIEPTSQNFNESEQSKGLGSSQYGSDDSCFDSYMCSESGASYEFEDEMENIRTKSPFSDMNDIPNEQLPPGGDITEVNDTTTA
ncbi:unnamed protein product [Agarophyton chilense]